MSSNSTSDQQAADEEGVTDVESVLSGLPDLGGVSGVPEAARFVGSFAFGGVSGVAKAMRQWYATGARGPAQMRGCHSSSRGQSETLGYVFSLALVSLLVVGTTVTAQSLLSGQEKIQTADRMEEEGQRLAAAVMAVDRLVRQSDSDGEIAQSLDLPTQIRGDRYRIHVINETRAASNSTCDRACILLRTASVTRKISFHSESPIESTQVLGGPVEIIRPDNGSHIRLRSDDQ